MEQDVGLLSAWLGLVAGHVIGIMFCAIRDPRGWFEEGILSFVGWIVINLFFLTLIPIWPFFGLVSMSGLNCLLTAPLYFLLTVGFLPRSFGGDYE